jgi:predicted secreted protein with PEFG-CTERM motif
MNKTITLTLLMTSVLLTTTFSQLSSAESYQDKVDFASSLEETLGHFWALEQNLDDKNAELALIHATHPIAELYDSIKPQLKAANPQLDAQVQDILMNLQNRANTDMSREQAQQAIDDAKGVVDIARSTVVGDELSKDPMFKLDLMKVLLDTSMAEYGEAVSDGMIEEMAEFQDGSAFVWRSQQIFETIRSDVDSHIADEIDEAYGNLWDAYDKKADPSQVEMLAGSIIHEIDEVLGVDGTDQDNLLEYVENIRGLLIQTKQEYSDGNTDLALSLATKAYLDNYEFLEAPLIELDQRDLMEEVEVMLREDLRNMIKNGEPTSKVNSHVDAILEKMDTIATVVPEFGTITMMILAVSIISIVAVTTKSKIRLRV